MAVIDELLVNLGFEYDPNDLEEFQSDLDDTIDLVKQLAAAFAAGTAVLVGFVTATTAASDEQGKLADEVGVTVDQLDALQFANRRAGGSAEGLASNLQQLSIRIGEAARGVGSGIEAFGLLDVSVTKANGELKTTDEVLLEVADNFDKFSKAQQLEIADKLGLRDSVRLLQQGAGGIQDLITEAEALGVTTARDAALSAEFQDSLTDIWQIVKQLSRTLTASLVPVMEDVANQFTEWWIANREIIEQNIPEFIEKAAEALEFLTFAAIAFISVNLINTFVSLISLLKGLTAATLAANAAAFLLPTLIAAGIASLALLAEDAKVFFEGGESFLGNMIEKFPQWTKELQTVAAIFATLADLVSLIADGWKAIFDLFQTDITGDLSRNLNQLKNEVLDAIPSVEFDIFGRKPTVENDNSEDDISPDQNANIFSRLQTDVLEILPEFGVNTQDQTALGRGPTLESSAFIPSDIPSAGNNGNTVQVDGGINIQIDGSASPIDTAEEVRRQFDDIVQQTSSDLNSAVRI